jgi:Tfp pilus assembly protein PilO
MKSQGLLGPILIAAAILVFFVLVMPLYDKIKATQQAVDERTAMLANLEGALSKVQELKGEMDSNSRNVEKVSGIITGPKNSDEILVILETIANDSGIDLTGIEMGKGKSEGKYQIINLKLDGASSYYSIQSFLDKMERSTRLFDVTKLSMSETGVGSVLQFILEAKVYYLE